MAEPGLFDSVDGGTATGGTPGADGQPGLTGRAPLAARMRPRSLEEFRGQDALLGPGRPLRHMLESGEVSSMILWGPPGSGKTTLARILADGSDAAFVPFSAVTEGVPRVREIIAEARTRKRATGRETILFCDEIHRFNKAQQDAFLPHVEDGTVTLIGATTENPSFEIVRPLLSRAPVFVLEPLSREALREIVLEALEDVDRGLGGASLTWSQEAVDSIAERADGDARRALGALEAAARLVGPGGEILPETVADAMQRRIAIYDKGGEEHFNLISALHKAVRGSDPDAALYWLARMIEGGEDPRYIARRVVRMASEDIGLADPAATGIALHAGEVYRMLGSPEGELALAEAVVYLATAPKSNRVYAAWKAARELARDTPAEPVPLHIRNAPTDLMRSLGYGRGYQYDHDEAHGVSAQSYLPTSLEGRKLYDPGPFGHESTIRKRLEWWAERRREAREPGSAGDGAERARHSGEGEPDENEGRG